MPAPHGGGGGGGEVKEGGQFTCDQDTGAQGDGTAGVLGVNWPASHSPRTRQFPLRLMTHGSSPPLSCTTTTINDDLHKYSHIKTHGVLLRYSLVTVRYGSG